MKQTSAVAKDDRNEGRQRVEKADLLDRMRERIHGKPNAGWLPDSARLSDAHSGIPRVAE
ncbi:hypothetical protein EST92_25290 [Streptomyces sp. TM32]|uniref:hypothetical protein n=1 Tax=Streptomyces sp. TM32 TaxID=1652669 RepID=UPI00101038A9|nr:hypothetical protein [Streptomyces sp. TM32]RXS69708.1 hypothetical protein EST92_25290 [Streptomyces sp. TM32]